MSPIGGLQIKEAAFDPNNLKTVPPLPPPPIVGGLCCPPEAPKMWNLVFNTILYALLYTVARMVAFG